MPTQKVADIPKICRHPDHNVPTMQYFENGVYRHTCPGCGHQIQFVVSHPTF